MKKEKEKGNVYGVVKTIGMVGIVGMAMILSLSMPVSAQLGPVAVYWSGNCPQASTTCTATIPAITSPTALLVPIRIGSITLQNKCPVAAVVTNMADKLLPAPGTAQYVAPNNNISGYYGLGVGEGVTQVTVTRGCKETDQWQFMVIVQPYANGVVRLGDSAGQADGEGQSWPTPLLSVGQTESLVVSWTGAGPNMDTVTPSTSQSWFHDHFAVALENGATFSGPTATTGAGAGMAISFQGPSVYE
jgi:hypothetical protein